MVENPKVSIELSELRKQIIKTGKWNDLDADWDDAFIIKEIFYDEVYKALPIENNVDIVLDLGAHSGWFADYVRTRKGARQVISVEPYPPSCRRWRRNHADVNDLLYEGAVVGDNFSSPKVLLNLAPATFGNSITKVGKRANAVTLEVDAFRLTDLTWNHKPTIAKVDVEGTEYDLFLPEVPESFAYNVKHVIMELHFSEPRFVASVTPLLESFKRAGYMLQTPFKVPQKPTGWGRVILLSKE